MFCLAAVQFIQVQVLFFNCDNFQVLIWGTQKQLVITLLNLKRFTMGDTHSGHLLTWVWLLYISKQIDKSEAVWMV